MILFNNTFDTIVCVCDLILFFFAHLWSTDTHLSDVQLFIHINFLRLAILKLTSELAVFHFLSLFILLFFKLFRKWNIFLLFNWSCYFLLCCGLRGLSLEWFCLPSRWRASVFLSQFLESNTIVTLSLLWKLRVAECDFWLLRRAILWNWVM